METQKLRPLRFAGACPSCLTPRHNFRMYWQKTLLFKAPWIWGVAETSAAFDNSSTAIQIQLCPRFHSWACSASRPSFLFYACPVLCPEASCLFPMMMIGNSSFQLPQCSSRLKTPKASKAMRENTILSLLDCNIIHSNLTLRYSTLTQFLYKIGFIWMQNSPDIINSNSVPNKHIFLIMVKPRMKGQK